MRRAARQGRRRVGAHDDSGQMALLLIGLVAILFMLVLVVTAASKVFLAQRALSSAADGAAVAAANSVNEPSIYTGTAQDVLPLRDERVRQVAADYVAAAGLHQRFEDFGLIAPTGSADGRTATVSARAVVPLPLSGLLPSRWRDGYPISVTANARAPLAP